MDTSLVAGAESTLQSIASTATTLNADLQDALAKLSSARSVVDDVQSLALDVGKISTALNDVSDVLPLLIEIPVVGEAAEALSPVIRAAKEVVDGIRDSAATLADTTIKPVADALNDIYAGATRVQAVTSRIPGGCQTLSTELQVVSALYELVQTFAQFGGDAASEFVETVQKVEQNVSGAAPPIADTLQAISAATGTLHGVVQSIEQLASGAFEDALSAASGLADKLSPIYDAIQTVLGAIAPVRWALDVVGWIANEVLTPVLNFVLQETGLQALFDDIGQELASGLAPVQSVLAQVGAAIETDAIAGVQGVLGTAAAVKLEGRWQNLTGLAASFDPGSGSFRSVLTNALTAIAGNPDTPLPPWPQQQTNSTAGAAEGTGP